MLPIKLICLFIFFSFPSLSNMKPTSLNRKKTEESTKLRTLPKTKPDRHLNVTWPSIESAFYPNREKLSGLSPISMKGHHNLFSMKTKCPESSADALLSRLGTAFNFRYMAVDRPVYTPQEPLNTENGYQQDQPESYNNEEEELDFYVNDDFVRELEEGDYHRKQVASRKSAKQFLERIRRSGKSKKRKTPHRFPNRNELPWNCPTQLIWRDLGADHFPQFLRSVRCLTKDCWFSHFRCLPKAFTMKVLKRKSDECVPIPSSDTTVTQYEQHWIFEERAVTFCCECVDY